jgi:hypothetical protein
VGGRCLQHHLHKAMHHCGGKLHTSSAVTQAPKAGLHGSLELPGLDSKLDMQLPGVKLFALELAALQGSAQQVMHKLEHQAAEELDQVGAATGRLHAYVSCRVGSCCGDQLLICHAAGSSSCPGRDWHAGAIIGMRPHARKHHRRPISRYLCSYDTSCRLLPVFLHLPHLPACLCTGAVAV